LNSSSSFYGGISNYAYWNDPLFQRNTNVFWNSNLNILHHKPTRACIRAYYGCYPKVFGTFRSHTADGSDVYNNIRLNGIVQTSNEHPRASRRFNTLSPLRARQLFACISMVMVIARCDDPRASSRFDTILFTTESETVIYMNPSGTLSCTR
jgi:hypothetical protein